MQHPNSRISLEVIDVEGEDAGDGVDVHSGNQACIMDVYARYAVSDDEVVPLAVDVRGVVDQRENRLQAGYIPFCLGQAESQPVALGRAGSHAPQLDEVLREDAEPFLAAQKRQDGASGLPVQWAAVRHAPQQDVGVNEAIRRPCGR